MNILVEDKNGQWWKFFGVKDHLFEVLWAGDKYSTGFKTSAVAEAPIIEAQSGRKTPGEPLQSGDLLMARPRQDLRPKALLPTFFSNLRIGKLGKTRPWLFLKAGPGPWRAATHTGYSSGSRNVWLSWSGRTIPNDRIASPRILNLLADSSAEDRVIQKYEVDGTWYGCFPHFEEHNSMERRGKPQLPFPPGTKSPWTPRETEKELEKKTEKETETELELEGDLGKPRLTSVNGSAHTVSLADTGETPVPPTDNINLCCLFELIDGESFRCRYACHIPLYL